MQRRVVCGLATAIAVAFCYLKSYEVTPSRAAWSGWTNVNEPSNWVGNTFTCSFDSIVEVQVFVGDTGRSHAPVKVEVYEHPDGAMPIAYNDGVAHAESHVWLRFPMTTEAGQKFVRGKEYIVRVTRPGDSVNYYWQESAGGGPYKYGEMVVGGQVQEDRDLCLRLMGIMEPVGDRAFGAVFQQFKQHPDTAAVAIGKGKAAGIRRYRDDFYGWKAFAENPGAVADKGRIYADSNVSVLGILCYGLDAYTTKPAPAPPGLKPEDPTMYPPQNLYEPVFVSAGGPVNQYNYWAHYVNAVMESLPEVVYFECWNEVNVLDEYFGNPDEEWYRDPFGGPIDTPRERCSLYVRMCYVAKKVAAKNGRKIVGGAVGCLWGDPAVNGSPGLEWIADMLDISREEYGSPDSCWDLLSVHCYQPMGQPFQDSSYFSRELDSLNSILRTHDARGREVWVTEFGWPLYKWDKSNPSSEPVPVPGATAEGTANNISEFYVSSIGRQADPAGGYASAYLYELTDRRLQPSNYHWGFGLLDSTPDQEPRASWYAVGQASQALVGKRLNGRVMSDSEEDNLYRCYELEDPQTLRRTWVSWVNGGCPPMTVQLPVRCDDLVAESLCYHEGNPPPIQLEPETDGWAVLDFPDERPVFVTEAGVASRPDMIVDSVRLVPPVPKVGEPLGIWAWLRNQGNGSIPGEVEVVKSRTWVTPYYQEMGYSLEGVAGTPALPAGACSRCRPRQSLLLQDHRTIRAGRIRSAAPARCLVC